jgi:pyruvate/2-oxoglutarate dehydrogenase complex dihydrolipoamide acyltransferase (E2) component
MTLQNLKSIEWWLARAREPSTRVALGVILGALGLQGNTWVNKLLMVGGALFAILGITTPEGQAGAAAAPPTPAQPEQQAAQPASAPAQPPETANPEAAQAASEDPKP